jgi:Leucine-rich repeat (LRR) protein
MKKITSVILIGFCFMFLLVSPKTSEAATDCPNYAPGQKVYWDGVELKSGQIGRLTVLKDTSLYKLNGDKEVYSRTLKAGEFYRIYAFKPGKLSVGGGYYVDRDNTIKYETPSKVKLQAVNCITQETIAKKETSTTFNTISTQFPDPVLAKEVANLLNKSVNDRITQGDIDKILEINLEKKGITSIEGLEVFKNLVNILLPNNQITKIDSKNVPTNVQYISLYNNKITSFHLNDHPKLYTIALAFNNVSDFKISNIPNLEILDLVDSKITSLSLSDYPKLDSLSLSNNNLLSDLRLSNLPKLRFLAISETDSLNQVTLKNFPSLKLIFSGNSGLQQLTLDNLPNLEQVLANNNQISSIVFKGLPNLKLIALQENGLQNIQLSNLPKLDSLFLSDNSLTTLNVSNLPSLRLLNVANNRLIHFPEGILELPSLSELYIFENEINQNSVNDQLIHEALLDKGLKSYSQPFPYN